MPTASSLAKRLGTSPVFRGLRGLGFDDFRGLGLRVWGCLRVRVQVRVGGAMLVSVGAVVESRLWRVTRRNDYPQRPNREHARMRAPQARTRVEDVVDVLQEGLVLELGVRHQEHGGGAADAGLRWTSFRRRAISSVISRLEGDQVVD